MQPVAYGMPLVFIMALWVGELAKQWQALPATIHLDLAAYLHSGQPFFWFVGASNASHPEAGIWYM